MWEENIKLNVIKHIWLFYKTFNGRNYITLVMNQNDLESCRYNIK